jgi:hypothetical protein
VTLWRGPGLVLAGVLLASVAPAQEKGREETALVDALLSGLLGFRDVTPTELQDEVAAIGGVPFLSPVALGYMTHAEFSVYLKGVLDDEYPTARASADERLLVALDLLPPGTDLRQLRGRMLEENVAGFYDDRPGRKKLYSVSDDRRLTPSNQLVLSHELRHALQDQHADIHNRLPDAVGDFDDRRFAYVALLEGDATLVMERFLASRVPGLESSGVDLSSLAAAAPVLDDVPPVLRDQLLLPYLVGHGFVRALWERGGWPAVKRAWEEPPVSTEQVLHPEKYTAREAPRAVPATRAPPGGLPVIEGVLGEVLINTLVGGAPGAAAGWGGDRYQVWDVKGRTLLAWRSVWDTAEERREFLAAFYARLEKSHGPRRTLLGSALFGKARWSLAVREEDESVLVLSSDDAGVLTAALQELGGSRK